MLIDAFVRIFGSKSFALFLLLSGIAALVNIGSRLLIDIFAPYAVAVVIAYVVGMITAYTLNRVFNFKNSDRKIGLQIVSFIVVNLLGLLQTLAVSVLLADVIFPLFNFTFLKYGIAHIVGVATPIFTSFIGHKYFTFGNDNFKAFANRIKTVLRFKKQKQ